MSSIFYSWTQQSFCLLHLPAPCIWLFLCLRGSEQCVVKFCTEDIFSARNYSRSSSAIYHSTCVKEQQHDQESALKSFDVDKYLCMWVDTDKIKIGADLHFGYGLDQTLEIQWRPLHLCNQVTKITIPLNSFWLRSEYEILRAPEPYSQLDLKPVCTKASVKTLSFWDYKLIFKCKYSRSISKTVEFCPWVLVLRIKKNNNHQKTKNQKTKTLFLFNVRKILMIICQTIRQNGIKKAFFLVLQLN